MPIAKRILLLLLIYFFLFYEPLLFAQSAITATIIEWQPNGEKLAVGYENGKVEIYQQASGQLAFTLTGHTDAITAIGWHPTDDLIITASEFQLFSWDVSTGQLISDLLTITDAQGSVYGITWDQHAERIITSHWNSLSRLQIRNADDFSLLTLSDMATYRFIWNPSHTEVYGVTSGGGVDKFDPQTFQRLFSLEHGLATELALNSNDSVLATGNTLGSIMVWNILPDHFELATTLQANAEDVDFPRTVIKALAFSPEGDFLYSVRGDGSLIWWNWQTGQAIETVQLPNPPIYAAAFSPDGTRLAYSGANGLVEIVEIATLFDSQLPTSTP